MEIKKGTALSLSKGYKNTEVGVIPEDWSIEKLGNLANVSSGGTPNRGIAKYWNGTIPWITTTQIDFNTIFEANEYITEEGLNNSAAKIFKKGTLLMAMYGQGKTRGKIAILGINASTNQACVGIVLNQEANKEYIFCNLSGRYDEIRSLSNTGNQENLSGELIKKINIPLPPTKVEQTAIAIALSDADALINSLEKLIAKKRNIKQGAMQRCLNPDFRDLYDDHDLKKSSIQDNHKTQDSDKWEVKKLGDCLLKNPDYGINAAAVDFDDTLPTYLRITDISDEGKYLTDNKASVNNILSDSYYLEEDDIVFARTGASVGKTYLYNKKDGQLVFAGFLIRVKANPEILNSKYLFYLTQTKPYWSWVLANSMRSGQPGLNSNEFKSFQLFVPSKSEQTRIATILSDMDAEIQALETKLEKYRKIKLGMMQNLLTGKIRLV